MGALGLVITTDVPVEGRHAIPVYVDDTLPIVGPSRACVVSTGDIPQSGGAPIAVRLAPVGTPAIGPAIPVYIVSGILGSAAMATVAYLLRATFPTANAAPLASPYAVDIGSLTIVDSAGTKVSTNGSRLLFASTITTSFADPRVSDAAGTRSRTAGRVWSMTVQYNGQLSMGFGASADTFAQLLGATLNSGSTYFYDGSAQLGPLRSSGLANGTDYVLTVMERGDKGGMAWIQGGSFATPRLLFVGSVDITIPLKAMIGVFTGSGAIQADDMALYDAGSAWSIHYPGASFTNDYPTADDTATMPADAFLECSWFVDTAETFDLMVRRIDDNNTWIIRSTNLALSIIEKSAGVETIRATNTYSAGGFTTNTKARISVRCDGQIIYACGRDISGPAIRNLLYASATFQQTATGAKIGGAAVLYGFWIYPLDLAPPTFALASTTVPIGIYFIGDSRNAGSSDTTPSQFRLVGYPYWLTTYAEAARNAGVYEMPIRKSHSGFTTAQLRAAIDADLTAAVGNAPDHVVVNIGVNDLASMPVEATFKTNYAYILDAIHTKWPNARVWYTLVWGIGRDTESNTWASWVATVVASRSWAQLGVDERITIKAGDNGAARMADTLHYNTLGHQDWAQAARSAIGL